jgi:hypothetical protein
VISTFLITLFPGLNAGLFLIMESGCSLMALKTNLRSMGPGFRFIKKTTLSEKKSSPFPLLNGTQIKVSDTILQVDWD